MSIRSLRSVAVAPGGTYIYEFRRGDEIVATGQITLDEEPARGSRLRIGRHEGVVRSVDPKLGNGLRRVRVELPGDPGGL